MKVMFLDFDGVLNSAQSATFWHNKRNQADWENQMYRDWPGTLKEYIAMEFCPIAMSNIEEVIRRSPGLKVVISSSWRVGETVETLREILRPSKIIGDAIIDKTESFHNVRGNEIQRWLDEHPEVTHYVIVDDDNDMLDSQKEHFVHTSSLHGFQYGDILWAGRILDKPRNP